MYLLVSYDVDGNDDNEAQNQDGGADEGNNACLVATLNPRL